MRAPALRLDMLAGEAMVDDPTRTLDAPDAAAASRGRPWLDVLEGAPVQRAPVPAGGLVIGRTEGVGLRLDADGVSRRHAKIVDHGDGIVNVLDLGSTNGTFLN